MISLVTPILGGVTGMIEATSYMSLEEYKQAIETFKNCQITSILWDILRMDV
jgi:hypothetical protein